MLCTCITFVQYHKAVYKTVPGVHDELKGTLVYNNYNNKQHQYPLFMAYPLIEFVSMIEWCEAPVSVTWCQDIHM